MHRRNKYIAKILSTFLAVLFVLEIVPTHLYAAAGEYLKEAFSSGPAVILGEVPEKRTENSKQYRMSDGTYQAVQYAQPYA